MGKPTICIGENKGADQLRSNCRYVTQYRERYRKPSEQDLVGNLNCWFSHAQVEIVSLS